MTKYVSLDLETSGLDPMIHDIIEVGLVTDDRKLTFSMEWDRQLADPQALEINQALTRELPPMMQNRDAMVEIASWLDDAHIVGKNPAFDRGFLIEYFATYQIEPNWHHRMVDVGPLAWGYYQGLWRNWNKAQEQRGGEQRHILDPPNLARTAQLMDIEIGDEAPHNALADAELAWEIFRKVVPRVKS